VARPTTDPIDLIEKLVLLATGRLAILFLAAWAFKYSGDLHRAHAEQSVIYGDRLAALGVAQNMLNATDSIEQKREVLKLLAEGYLNFEQSAFRIRRKAAAQETADKDVSVDRQIKHVRDAVEAVKPLFEAVGKVADKVK
jgi:hypothetical protein